MQIALEQRGFKCSLSTIKRAMARENLLYKDRRSPDGLTKADKFCLQYSKLFYSSRRLPSATITGEIGGLVRTGNALFKKPFINLQCVSRNNCSRSYQFQTVVFHFYFVRNYDYDAHLFQIHRRYLKSRSDCSLASAHLLFPHNAYFASSV